MHYLLKYFTVSKVLIIKIHIPAYFIFLAHLHHYNQTDGFDPEWFPEASRSLYDVIQLYKEVQKNVPIDTPRMRVLS